MKNGPYELVVAPPEYPGMKYRGKYVYEHQLVWWQNTGNLVPEGYVIHHENRDKRDNRFANLKLESRTEHGRHHANDQPKQQPVTVICGWCGSPFDVSGRQHWTRIKQTKSGHLFCCKSHQARYQHAHRSEYLSIWTMAAPGSTPGSRA